MRDFYEYYVEGSLDKQYAEDRAKRYSAKCRRKRIMKRKYTIAAVVGIALFVLLFTI